MNEIFTPKRDAPIQGALGGTQIRLYLLVQSYLPEINR